MDVGSRGVGIELASPVMGVATNIAKASDAALMSRVQSGDQDAFLRLYEKSSNYKEQGHLLPFLMRIATNLLRSEQRRASRWRNLVPSVAHDRPAPPPTPQRESLGREATEMVEEALAALPLRYRAPLVLREIEGLSYREIAVALECREGTVKSRISRSRAELRTLLEPYWNGQTGETA